MSDEYDGENLLSGEWSPYRSEQDYEVRQKIEIDVVESVFRQGHRSYQLCKIPNCVRRVSITRLENDIIVRYSLRD